MNSDKDLGRREELINGLLKLLTFLEAHPEVPINGWAEIDFCVPGVDDAAGIARTAGIAKELGVEMTDNHERAITDETMHFSAIRRFGPAVSYKATYIKRTQMDDWDALMSYRGLVRGSKDN